MNELYTSLKWHHDWSIFASNRLYVFWLLAITPLLNIFCLHVFHFRWCFEANLSLNFSPNGEYPFCVQIFTLNSPLFWKRIAFVAFNRIYRLDAIRVRFKSNALDRSKFHPFAMVLAMVCVFIYFDCLICDFVSHLADISDEIFLKSLRNNHIIYHYRQCLSHRMLEAKTETSMLQMIMLMPLIWSSSTFQWRSVQCKQI